MNASRSVPVADRLAEGSIDGSFTARIHGRGRVVHKLNSRTGHSRGLFSKGKGKKMKKRSGLTLLELLIILGCVLILAAILFPVFAQPHEHNNHGSCLSNLKQVGSATLMYAQDYDQTFPASGFAAVDRQGKDPDAFPLPTENPANVWIEQMQPYTKNYQVFYCASETAKMRSAYSPALQPGQYVSSYTLNRWTAFGLKQAEIAAPAQFVLIAERNNETQAPDGSYLFAPWKWRQDNYAGLMSQDLTLTRHSMGSNRSYADGHAKWFKFDQNAPQWQSGAFHP